MQPLSQRRTCHQQDKRHHAGDVKRNPLRSIVKFLTSALKAVVSKSPDYSHSLRHLSEHQLRDIGFTRELPDRKLPDTNIGFLHSGLHEHRQSRIRRLPKG